VSPFDVCRYAGGEASGVVSVIGRLCAFARETRDGLRRNPHLGVRGLLVKAQFHTLIPNFDRILLKHWLIFADPPFPLSMFSVSYCMARDIVSAFVCFRFSSDSFHVFVDVSHFLFRPSLQLRATRACLLSVSLLFSLGPSRLQCQMVCGMR
jgi:hypothetical protein